MKITNSNRSGLNTIGLTGVVLMSAVVWGQLSPWWLLLAISLILSGSGLESK